VNIKICEYLILHLFGKKLLRGRVVLKGEAVTNKWVQKIM